MISLSHWGMFTSQPAPFLVPKGFKLSPEDIAKLRQPASIVEMLPLEPGEPQPIYYIGSDDP